MKSERQLFSRVIRHFDVSIAKKLIEEEAKIGHEKKKNQEFYLKRICDHNSDEYSNWRFDLDEGMTTSGMMSTTFPSTGEVDLDDKPANSDSTYLGGSGGLSGGVQIKDSGSGVGNNGGFDLGQSYLAFDGAGSPGGARAAFLNTMDTTKFDTMVLTAIRGNDSNGGEDPDEEGAELRLYYKTSTGVYRPINQDDNGNTINGINSVIIPVGNDTADLRSWNVTIPAHVRNLKSNLALYQQVSSGSGFDNYGVTQIRFQRRTPISVFVSLDDPEASAFVRTDPTFAGLTQEQKLKKLKKMLQDSDAYLQKIFGDAFPGTGAVAPGEERTEPGIEVTNYAPGPTENQPKSEKSFYDLYKDELEKSFKKPGQDNTDTYQQWIQTQPDKYNDPENYGFTGSESEPEPETRSNQEQSSYYPPAEDLADIGAKTPPPPREYGDRGKFFDDYYSKPAPKTDNDYVNKTFAKTRYTLKAFSSLERSGLSPANLAASLSSLEDNIKYYQDAAAKIDGNSFMQRMKKSHLEREALKIQASIDELKTKIIKAARAANQRTLNAKFDFEMGGTFDEYIDAYYQSYPEDVKDLINKEVENVESGVTDYKFSPLAKRIVDVILNLPEGLPLPYFSSARTFAQYAQNIIDSDGKSGGVIENPLIDKEVNDILKNVDLNQIGEYGKAETLFQSGIAALSAGHTTFGSGGYTVEITDDGITITDPSYKFAKGGANPIPDQAWGDYFAGPLSLATVPIGLLVFGPNPPKASATLVQKIPMSQIQKVNPALYKKLQENPNFGRPGRTAPTPTPTPEKPKPEPKKPKPEPKKPKVDPRLGVDATSAATAAAEQRRKRKKKNERRGSGIKESVEKKKKLKSPTEIMKKIPGYYDGKPSPLGFPMDKPPKMVNGFHPDLVDGKKVSDRFNKLDPISARSMPPTGNPHIDKKVKAAARLTK